MFCPCVQLFEVFVKSLLLSLCVVVLGNDDLMFMFRCCFDVATSCFVVWSSRSEIIYDENGYCPLSCMICINLR